MKHTFENGIGAYDLVQINPGQSSTLIVFLAGRGAASLKDVIASAQARLAEENALTAVVVRARRDCWYQDEGAAQLFEVLARVARGYRRVIAVGADMGAHGVCRLSEVAQLDEAILISPVAELDPRRGPQDWRFDEDFEALGAFIPVARHGARHYTVFYDPAGAENRQVRAMNLPPTRTTLQPMPGTMGAGHAILHDSPLWKALLLASAGQGAAPDLRELKPLRRHALPYLESLCQRNATARPRVAAWAMAQMQQRGVQRWRLDLIRARMRAAA